MPPVGRDLPEFKTPPVIEVVCGVQFEPLKAFSSVHLGDFWHRIKKQYPRTEDRPPLPDIFEGTVGLDVADLLELPPLRRVFYIEATNNFLLQVQSSRFLANWRKVDQQEPYPRFGAAYDRFVRGWELFLGFLKDTGLGSPKVNQYELTYINHIFEGEAPFPGGIEDLVPVAAVRSARTLHYLPEPGGVGVRLRFPLFEKKGTVHVKIDLGKRQSDAKSVVLMDLTARGPALADWSDMKDWFNLAHEAIVCGFADLTSPNAHRLWGRTR